MKTSELGENSKFEMELKEFYQLSGDDRVKKMMEWGDKVDISKIELIKHAIVNDLDLGVKMAALKRIHLFNEKTDVKEFLTSQKTKEVCKKCEPYYSMALSKTGVISIEEFKRRLGT